MKGLRRNSGGRMATTEAGCQSGKALKHIR
jgi:hypothetical protein